MRRLDVMTFVSDLGKSREHVIFGYPNMIEGYETVIVRCAPYERIEHIANAIAVEVAVSGTNACSTRASYINCD